MDKNLLCKCGIIGCALIVIIAMMLSYTPISEPTILKVGSDVSMDSGNVNDEGGKTNGDNDNNDRIDDIVNRFLLTLAPGLYDNNGRLVASWDVLTTQYGLECEKDYTANNLFSGPGSLFSIVDNSFTLTNGVVLVIDSGVTRIGNGALALQPNIRAVVIPDSVTSIGVEAFVECAVLNKILFCGTMEQWQSLELGDYWCGYAPATTVLCSDGPIDIPVDAYYGFYSDTTGGYAYCGGAASTKRTDVNIESKVLDRNKKAWSVARIEANAFENFEAIDTVVIPASIIEIGDSAFAGCENLTTIVFEGTTKQWNAIKFGRDWNYNVPATHVQCSNGVITID